MVLVVIEALDILEFVARDTERAYSRTDIAAGLGMNQATCVNILQTLVEKSYLEHMGRKKGYRLGPKVYDLTNNQAYSLNLNNGGPRHDGKPYSRPVSCRDFF